MLTISFECVSYTKTEFRFVQTYPLIISNSERRLDDFPVKIIIGSNKIKLNHRFAMLLIITLDCFHTVAYLRLKKLIQYSFCAFLFSTLGRKFSIFSTYRFRPAIKVIDTYKMCEIKVTNDISTAISKCSFQWKGE